MGIRRQFYLHEGNDGVGSKNNIVEKQGDTLLRVFPVDDYELPEEVKRQAKEWHVLKVPLLGQQMLSAEQAPDWCGRTSASMVYNYFQLLKGGDPRQRYITHSRAGDPECLLDLRFPGGERAFLATPFDRSLPKMGWTVIPEANGYEIQSSYTDYNLSLEGEIPLPMSELFPPTGKRPAGVGGVLRYQGPKNYDENIGHLLPAAQRHRADDFKNNEKLARERFDHLLTCLRANNPVVIYTGIGFKSADSNPRHIIVISGYCIMDVGGTEQLWLVTADPSSKYELAKNFLPAPNGGKGRLDLGHRLEPHHALFRMRSGSVDKAIGIDKFASLNLVRASALFGKNPDSQDPEYNRFLDHAQTHCGRYIYRERRTEVPPELVDSSFSRPKYGFPLRGNNASSHPWQCYYNNESLDTGIGGYYVLGLQRNLHGGAHLFPPTGQDFAPVSAVAPGYVVAARLPGERAPSLAPGVAEALGNWPGFVLLRHEVQELSKDTHMGADEKPPGRRGTFYTLYMHLRSPVFPPENGPQARSGALDRYFKEVPWFQRLYKQRFGAWVSIADDEGAPPGTLRWSEVPVAGEDQKPPEEDAPPTAAKEYPVLAEDGTSKPITVRDEKGRLQWLYKAPPGNLQAAVRALADGRVVTFDEPFFPVDTGEVLGFVSPLPGERSGAQARFQVPADADVPGRRKQFTLRSGFLHFQLFCPEDEKENGIKLLTELARGLEMGGASPLEFVEVTEDQEDNFLEVSEIENHLKGALPAEDRESFSKATAEVFAAAREIPRSSMNYGGRLASILDSKTSFAPEAEKPDWSSPCCRFAYPLKLEVEALYLPRPEQNPLVTGGSYELELCFEQEVAGQWMRVECPRGGCGGEENGRKVCKPAVLELDSNKLAAAKNGLVTLSLKVPALAERMTLKAKGGFFIEQAVALPGADARLLAQGITRRWRNVRLVQKNEWTPDSVSGVLEKVNATLGATLLEPREESVDEIAWWTPAKEAHIARIPPMDGAKPPAPGPKLFEAAGRLAPGSRLENLHPVTAVWLLNVLHKQNKAFVQDEWTVPSFRQEDPRPLCSGWVVKDGDRRVGETLFAAIIDEDFGYDPRNRVTLLARQGGHELVLAGGREFGPGGNIFQQVQTAFWGEWSLEVTDTSEPPKTLTPKSRLPLLAPKVSVLRPKLVGEQAIGEPVMTGKQPQRQADGSWRWVLPFEAAAPRELSGFILLRTDRNEQGPGSPHPERVIPVTARPLTGVPLPPVDETLFVLGGGKDKKDVITGLTKAGQVVWKDPNQKLYVINDVLRFMECVNAMDIRVGWGLVQGLARLAAKKLRITMAELSADGHTCTLKSSEPLERFAIPGAKATQAGDGLVDLEFAPAACEQPKLQNLWVFDERRECILNSRPAAAESTLGPLKFRDYRSAYFTRQPYNLHVALANALAQAAKALGKKTLLVIERIEASGLGAIINASGKSVADRVRSAAATGGFEVMEADPARKSQLRLVANPTSGNSLVVSFQPKSIFDGLTRSELEPGAELYYWFDFVALNGQPFLHRLDGGVTGEGDGSLTLEQFESLKARTSEPICATHPGPGRFRKVGLRDMVPAAHGAPARQMALKPAPRLGQCELEISVSVSGAPEDLNKYTATFFRKSADGKKWMPLQGFTKLRPGKLDIRGDNGAADWLVAARVPYPLRETSKQDGTTEFKVEFLALPGSDREPRQLEATGTYDFKPRWEGALKAERKGGLLELRCHGEGLEVPLPGSRDARAWNVAREFEVVIEPDTADPHLEDLKPKLSEHLRYATPTPDGKRGGCDLEGDFVATLDLQALEPGAPYTFTLQRPRKRAVRQTVIPPIQSEPFTRTRDEE